MRIMLVFFISISSCLYSQDFSGCLIFRGELVSQEKNNPLSNLVVYNKSLKIGVFTDTSGSFSVYYNIGDTLVCSGLAYESKMFVTSDSSNNERKTISLVKKNILLKEKVIYPWPSKEQFKSEFLALKIVDPVLDRVKKSLSKRTLFLKQGAYTPGAYLNYKWFIEKQIRYR